MFNNYTEEFRENAVAVVRAGVRVNSLAKRLHIPPTTIRNWIDNPRYAEIGPVDRSLIDSLPSEVTGQNGLVRIGQNEIFQNPNILPAVKIKVGQVEIETPENISVYSIMVVFLHRWDDFYGFTFNGKMALAVISFILMHLFTLLFAFTEQRLMKKREILNDHASVKSQI